VERILALKRVSLLAGLPAEEVSIIAEHARERFFAKGTALLREGEPISAIHVILDGRAHLSRRGQVMGHVTAGGVVGGMGMLGRDVEGLAAVAETDTQTLELEVDAVLEIFEDHFPILHHALRENCRDVLDLMGRLPPHLYQQAIPPFADVKGPATDLDLVDRILFLRQIAPFARSSINALAELSRGLAEVSFPPGTTVWKEGEASGSVLLVVSGTVMGVARGGAARFSAGAGTPLGSVESMAERPRWFNLVADTKVSGLHGSLEGLIDVFEDNFEMAMDYLALIARWQLRILEMRVSAVGQSVERFYGCDEAPDDPN
jgi:CRP-like cAMP-binding protein